MAKGRIESHPILSIEDRREISFKFNGKKLVGLEGDMISSALIAAGFDIFSYHQKDNAPQGIFCANGQCAQCTVIVDGVPQKACMTPLKAGMNVQSCKGLPELPKQKNIPTMGDITTYDFEVLIIGGGPAGLSAAIELGKLGVDTLLIDDKASLGGKLILQTHKFFGSIDDCYAGTRGYKIAEILQNEVLNRKSL
jgi:sarcosine oxidase subunit alpha